MGIAKVKGDLKAALALRLLSKKEDPMNNNQKLLSNRCGGGLLGSLLVRVKFDMNLHSTFNYRNSLGESYASIKRIP